MMANNTPAVRMPRQFYSAPHIPRASGGSNFVRTGESVGRNPLAGAKDDSGQGDYIAPPNHVGGLLGLVLDPQRDKDYEERVNARDTARMQKVQAGIDAYGQALEKTGDPRAALMQTFHPDSEGHVHFADKETFSKIIELHNAALAGQPLGNWQTQDLGNGLVGVTDPNQRTSVHTAGQGVGKGLTTGYRVDPQTGAQIPIVIDKNSGTSRDVQTQSGETAVRKQPGPPRGLNPQERTELNDLDTVMQELGTLQQTTSATGLLTGHLQRFTAQHTELSPTQAAAYNRAYDQMAPALLRLERVPGQSKLVAQQAMQMLPHPGQADAYNLSQVIPGLQQQMRQHIANTYDSWHAEGKDTTVVQKLAMAYDAGPKYMDRLRNAHLGLQSGAGNLDEQQMRDLEDEQLHNRLTYDQSLRVTRQRIARGMMDPAEFDKAVAAHPELAQISDSERTAPQYLRQWQPPQQPQVAPIQPTAGQQQQSAQPQNPLQEPTAAQSFPQAPQSQPNPQTQGVVPPPTPPTQDQELLQQQQMLQQTGPQWGMPGPTSMPGM